MALAEWLIRELDRAAPPGQSMVSGEHKIPGAKDDTVRVIYLQNASAPPQLHEMAVNLRALANIQFLLVSTPPRAIAVRAPELNVSFAIWLVKALDSPPSRSARQYRSGVDEIAHVSYLREDTGPRELQEMAVNIRTMANISFFATANAIKAVCFRGTGRQVELGAWLAAKLDEAALPGTTAEWGTGEDGVRVHYLRPSGNYQKLQEAAKQIRATGMRYVGTSTRANAVIVRGNATQLAEARRIVEELDR